MTLTEQVINALLEDIKKDIFSLENGKLEKNYSVDSVLEVCLKLSNSIGAFYEVVIKDKITKDLKSRIVHDLRGYDEDLIYLNISKFLYSYFIKE